MPTNEEARHIANLKRSRKAREKRSPEWTNLKKVKRKNREARDDGQYRKQITLDEQ
jgi:hypothetical protein